MALCLGVLALLCTPFAEAYAQDKPAPRAEKKAKETKEKAKTPTTRRASPVKRKPGTRIPPLPLPPSATTPEGQKKKKNIWGSLVERMGKLVPKGVKKRWKRTQKKWKQTVEVYRAMSKLLSEDERAKRERLKREKREEIRDRWKKEDKQIETRIKEQMRLNLWQQACHSGSAKACIEWAKQKQDTLVPWRLLRDIWLRRKQWEKLLPLCKRLHEMAGHQIEDTICYAQALSARDKIPQAIDQYKKLAKAHGNYGPAWLFIGQLYHKDKKPKLAQQACRKATVLMPQEPHAWHCLGETLRGHDKQAALRAHYTACKMELASSCRAVLALRPKGVRGLLWWSSTVARISARGISQGTLSQSCRVGIRSACQRLANSYRQRAKRMILYKRWSQADWWFRRAAHIAPDDHKNWRELGLFLASRKRWRQARPALQRTLKLNNNQPLLWYTLAQCHSQLSRTSIQSAREAYKRACALGKHAACKHINFPR